MKNTKGFSLIEVLITLSIISALSAIAVPQYMKYKDMAKRAEAETYINTIVKAEKLVYASSGVYQGMSPATGTSNAKLIGDQQIFSPCSGGLCTNYIYHVDVGVSQSTWGGARNKQSGGGQLGVQTAAGCTNWNSSADNDSFAILAVGELNEDTTVFLDAVYYQGGMINGTSAANRMFYVCNDIGDDRPESMPSGSNCSCR